jgi:hypothetical protein
MNTHLSEASVNSLLTLVKGANTSRSYDDKINILTKAGILHGGQKYSSRVESLNPGLGDGANQLDQGDAANPTDPDYTVMVPVSGDAVKWFGARGETAYRHLNNLKTLAIAARVLFNGPQDRFVNGLTAIAMGKQVDSRSLVWEAHRDAANALDKDAGGRVYTNVLEQVVRTGLFIDLATLVTYQSDRLADPKMLDEIAELFLGLGELGLRIEEIIKQGSAYLSTIPDGKYNFRVFPANTSQPVILTGTAVITSQYDQYSSILLQKLINNTIVGTPPITALQTLDISYNSRQVDTSGSSSTGKYTVVGNTATITSNGYSKAAGAFVDTETIIITFPAFFYVINNRINQDKSKTTISLTIYTRQLTSGELDGLLNRLFGVANTNGDEGVSLDELGTLFTAVAAGAFQAADSNGDGVISGPEANLAIQNGRATTLPTLYAILQSLANGAE